MASLYSKQSNKAKENPEHCPQCLAYYPPGFNHDCPPWLISPKTQEKWKKAGWIDNNGSFTDKFPLKEFKRHECCEKDGYTENGFTCECDCH